MKSVLNLNLIHSDVSLQGGILWLTQDKKLAKRVKYSQVGQQTDRYLLWIPGDTLEPLGAQALRSKLGHADPLL